MSPNKAVEATGCRRLTAELGALEMGIFDRFKPNVTKQDEITLQGIKTYGAQLDAASGNFLTSFGPDFTKTRDGHIATDIAGASAISSSLSES